MNGRRSLLTAITVGLLACGLAHAQAPARLVKPDVEIKLADAELYKDGLPGKLNIGKDGMGPGLDAVYVSGETEVRFSCKNVPEGDYYPALMTSSWSYTCFTDVLAPRSAGYLNDSRVRWIGTTEPVRVRDRCYRAEMILPKMHIKPTDVIRTFGSNHVLGALRLYKQPPAIFAECDNSPDGFPLTDTWLRIEWLPAKRTGETVVQSCKMWNPGVLPRAFTLKVEGRDYFMRHLLDNTEQITLTPNQAITRTYELKLTPTGSARLSLRAAAADQNNAIRASQFYVGDLTQGPRANLLLNGEWDVCLLKAVEPGNAPPAGAAWTKLNAPSDVVITSEKNKGVHCAWYRKTIDAPAYLRGERVIFRCNEMMSAGKVYVNGMAMGGFHYGSDPFEVDITAGFRPGQKNEILIAVQDWLAYSPKNRQRVLQGEEPIYKDGMLDVADYDAVDKIGIRGKTWLETRAAVSVENLFIATSVREKKLTVRYVLKNTGKTDQKVRVEPVVLDAGLPVKTLAAKSVTVPAGKTAEVTFAQDWADAKYWWSDDPHLYILQTAVKPASGDSDTHIQRFGFRELWIDGIHFVLNGTRVKIRTSCVSGAMGKYNAMLSWEQDKRYAAIWDQQKLCQEDRDVQLVRSHLWTRFEEGADIADESGMMIKLETGFHQQAFTLDKRFWAAATAYELHLVDLYKNHAAIVCWSGGNENMWGTVYQGEIAKTVFNDWQVKTLRAMEQFDPMHRPGEFEADSDLFGGSQYYSLHYPRELATYPDIPNSCWWGKLDKKTVIPYTQGPITLGTKPLTVGESFWPANLQHPYGETIICGDDAYRCGTYLTKAWLDSSRFFADGFRDLEFALLDSFVPMQMIKARKVVLKEETSRFFGGRTIHRRVNVHNDVLHAAKLTLKSALVAADGRELIKGVTPLDMAPAELERVVLDVKLPAVQQVTEATWRVQLVDETGNVLDVQERAWKLFPAPKLTAPESLKLAVYDPPGTTIKALQADGVPFSKITSLQKIPPANTSLIIGEDALKQPPEGAWREAVAAFVQKGGKVVVLAQGEPLDFLPVGLTLNKEHKTTISFLRAADHPVMANLTDADLKWWADDHYVSLANFRKPLNGNWLPLADAGTMEGMLESPLIEEYDGKGSYLLCQYLVASKAGTAAQADVLLRNMIHYLASPQVYRTFRPTALLPGTSQTLRQALESSRLIFTDLTGKLSELKVEKFGAAIADASAVTPDTAAALKEFAQSGGKVMVVGAAPAQQAALESVTGIGLTFLDLQKEGDDIKNRVLRDRNTGLLASISNHELFWASGEYLGLFRREGWWWNDCGPRPKAEWLADCFCIPAAGSEDKAAVLTYPCAMLQVPTGKGLVLINQFRLDRPFADSEATARRLRSLLLTNLGCPVQSEAGSDRARLQRLAAYQFTPIDLAPHGNRGLVENKAAGIVGWSNQGENDMRAFKSGPQKLAGIDFVVAAGKSAIALHSRSGMGNQELPKEVKGIKIAQKADMLVFLHVASYLTTADIVCHYRVNYADGTNVNIPIQNGRHIFDWWADPMKYADDMARNNTTVAWRGDNPMRKGLVALCFEWSNPSPEKEIASVDFLSEPKSNYEPVVFLLGLTAAKVQANEGVVEDIIGTSGVKVKIGTQVKEFHYIGVAGIDKSHPYYDKAIAAHKAMAVGQKVTVFPGEVPTTADGRSMAYVCLGKDPGDVRNMLNTRVLGDGLGKVGKFEGNNRHRMFMENLSFITEQGKKGMFGQK